MSEPEEKYTLPRVLEIVGGHAEALRAVGAALEASEGRDGVILALVGDYALRASDDLFEIENVRAK